jgi:hypothetical protein
MHQHNYVPPVELKESPVQGIIIAIVCIAVFALWGVLLALGV